MSPTQEILSSLFVQPEYGISARSESKTNEENSLDPSRAEFGIARLGVLARHRNVFIWKRKRHREAVFLFFIPIWWKWVNDEITLVGEINKTETTTACKIFDAAFGDHMSLLNLNNKKHAAEHIVLEWKSSTPQHKWTWNDARQQWYRVTNVYTSVT